MGQTTRSGELQFLTEPMSHLGKRSTPHPGDVFGGKSGTGFSIDVADHECHRLARVIGHLEMRQQMTVQPGTGEFVDDQVDFGSCTNIPAS